MVKRLRLLKQLFEPVFDVDDSNRIRRTTRGVRKEYGFANKFKFGY